MELLGYLAKDLRECVCRSCERKGCKLRLDSFRAHPILVIDCDKCRARFDFEGEICDFFVFYDWKGLGLAAVEIKPGLMDAKHAVRQIEKGCEVAGKIVDKRRVGDFFPILLYGRRAKSAEFKILRGAKVVFGGRKHLIIVEKCGASLSEIISEYSAA